ncbi:putative cysteine protease RD21B [Bienertia sinuspersici]
MFKCTPNQINSTLRTVYFSSQMDTCKQNRHHHFRFNSLIIFSFLLMHPCVSWSSLPEDLESENQIMEVFQQWQQKHGKSYNNADEELKRFQNFKHNFKYVSSNSKRVGFKVGLNQFSDLSSDEFKDRWLGFGDVINVKHKSSVLTCHAPLSFDWRTKGPLDSVNDQGVSGISRAVSSVDAVKENNVEHKIVNIDGYVKVEETENALLCATVNWPICVGIDGSSIDFQLYTGGIYDGACSSNPNDINHFVLIVGYGSEGNNDYWIVKNSWGTSWGMDGYIHIRRNTNLHYGVCAINAMASYPIQATLASSPSPSPSSTPPPTAPPQFPPSQPLQPPPAPSPPNHPPPPPGPTPSRCADFTYCLPGQTCCCLYESLGFCLIQGCCQYSNAVCCRGSDYCCPLEYPICDAYGGLCLKKSGDNLGVALTKKKWAKLALPWSKLEDRKEMAYQPLKWRRNRYAAAA